MLEEQQEDQAADEGELFRLLADHVTDYALFVVDVDGRIQHWPCGAERLLGYPKAEMLHQSANVLFTLEDQQNGQPEREREQARTTGRGEADRWLVRKDGSRFWAGIIITPLWDEASHLRGFAQILRDQTERKTAEQALQESEAGKAAVLETALDGIITIDGEDRIIEFNPAAERIFGYGRAEVLGQKMGELIVPPALRPQHYQGMAHYLATGEGPVLGKRLELSALRADGTEFPVELAITRVPTDEAIFFTGYARDISERKRQERRRAAQLTVTQVLAEAATVGEAAPRILEAICTSLGWDVGGFWLVDRAAMVLRCLDTWHHPAVKFDQFEKASREHVFALGRGLPGRVWSSGEPLWFSDLTLDQNFPRFSVAAEEGLRGAFAVPLLLGEQVLGVVEFLSRSMAEPDEDILGMMAAIGGQIGQFMQRKLAEEALRESEERFRGLMEQAPFSVQVFAPTGETLQVNRAWEELWGATFEQTADYNVLKDRQLEARGVLSLIQRAFAGEAVAIPAIPYDPSKTIPDRARRRGPKRWVSAVAYPLKDPNGQVREVILVHEDVTARQQAEDALRESEERFRGIVSHSIAGVAEVDLTGRFLFANERYCTIVGRSLDVLRKLKMQDISHPGDLMENLPLFEQIGRDGQPYVIEKRYLRPDGSEVWVNNSVSGLRGPKGTVKSVVAVCVDVTASRRAEAARQEGEKRLRALIDNLPHGTVYRAVQNRETGASRFTFLSAGVEQIFGITPEEGLADASLVFQTISEDDRNLIRAEEARALESNEQFDAEIRIQSRSGEPRWIHCRSAPHVLPTGEIAWDGIILDVTDRKRAEKTLRDHEDRLRLALDAGRMGTWDWDIRTNEVRWSPQLEAIHGLPPGGFPGTFEAYQRDIHPEDRERVFASIERAVSTGQDHHVEYRLVLPDNSIRWVEARGKVFRDSDGQPLHVIGVCMEVTERKKAEQDLRFLAEASRSLALVVDYESTLQKIAGLAVPHFADWCAIHLPEESGKLRQLAVAHVDPAKVQLAEVVSRRWPADPEKPGGVYQVFRTGQSVLIEDVPEAMLRESAQDDEHFELVRSLGLKSYVCVPLAVREHVIGVMTFIAAESGRHYTAADLALAEDLARRAAIASENARLYATLREEGRKKDEFLAMLAHELRNPLAPIRSGLDLLGLMGIDAEILDTMQQQVEHLVRLVDDLLDVSRIMRGKVELRREPVELSSLVTRAVETVRPLIESHRQPLSVDVPSEPIWLNADPVRLAQVIGNLLNNASKYTENGGQIRLTVEPRGEYVLLRVRDAGIGISPDLLPHVFDLFTQDQRTIDRSQGGLGIGLTVVKSLVEMHGGSVTVTSDGPGRGSEFIVRLPTVSRPQSESGSPDEAVLTPAFRILVVDDNVPAATMLGLLLEHLGNHQIFTAHDGLAALAAAKEHRPDLILLDIGLPKLDGFEVARRLRQHPEFQRIRVVALTGYGTEEDRRKSLDAGFDEHLVKPPGIDTLQQLLVRAKPELS